MTNFDWLLIWAVMYTIWITFLTGYYTYWLWRRLDSKKRGGDKQ